MYRELPPPGLDAVLLKARIFNLACNWLDRGVDCIEPG